MNISLLLIAGDNERFISAASEAARTAFAGSSVRSVSSLEKALSMDSPHVPEIIALHGASASDIERATQALDPYELPRWAVVASGESPHVAFAEVITEAGWQPAVLTRVFRSAVELHLLRRERDRLLGDLLTVGTRITHDLRTPLGGIMAATDALSEAASADPELVRSLVQPITESIKDLVAIIGQVSLLSKASARQLAPQAFNMGKAASRAVMRVEARAAREGATLLKPDSWPDVLGDPSHTESIWHILLENALMHSGKKKAKIEMGWEPVEEGFRFWVRDEGTGVPTDARGTLFQPFHRLHEASAVRGLGLPIVERLVALQGGRCGYEEQAKGGACFFFTLPSTGST
jgi:signal transduction histidine kinase